MCKATTYFLLGLSSVFAACGETDKETAKEALKPLTLVSTMPVCSGQRAVVPASLEIARTVAASSRQVRRTEMAAYVSYAVDADDGYLYLSFAPGLPVEFSTAEARSFLDYAHIEFNLKQPSDIGGNLTLLSNSVLLKLSDFDRFEVQNGVLAWRIVRTSEASYAKWLSTYDSDPPMILRRRPNRAVSMTWLESVFASLAVHPFW